MYRRRKKRRVRKYYVVYDGPHRNLKLTRIGKMIPGKEYEISEKEANTYRQDPTFRVVERYKYEEIE